jgi:ADP-ribose pyrophosphatase YjhB (NUDIX family)
VEAVERRAVRAVVVDARERVLLVRFSFPDGTDFWATPGGGVEGDEDEADALRRELAEESGLNDVVIGPCLWTRDHTFPWDGRSVRQRETIYLVRVGDYEAAPTVDLAAEGVAEIRWWTLAELAATAERIVPAALPTALPGILAGAIADPYDIGL